MHKLYDLSHGLLSIFFPLGGNVRICNYFVQKYKHVKIVQKYSTYNFFLPYKRTVQSTKNFQRVQKYSTYVLYVLYCTYLSHF